MTRDCAFKLTNANQWYNLWTLITSDLSWVDSTFTLTPFIANSVKELKYQNQGSGNVFISDNKLESGFKLTTGSSDVSRAASGASIDLQNRNFKSDVSGATLYVSIVY